MSITTHWVVICSWCSLYLLYMQMCTWMLRFVQHASHIFIVDCRDIHFERYKPRNGINIQIFLMRKLIICSFSLFSLPPLTQTNSGQKCHKAISTMIGWLHLLNSSNNNNWRCRTMSLVYYAIVIHCNYNFYTIILRKVDSMCVNPNEDLSQFHFDEISLLRIDAAKKPFYVGDCYLHYVCNHFSFAFMQQKKVQSLNG